MGTAAVVLGLIAAACTSAASTDVVMVATSTSTVEIDTATTASTTTELATIAETMAPSGDPIQQPVLTAAPELLPPLVDGPPTGSAVLGEGELLEAEQAVAAAALSSRDQPIEDTAALHERGLDMVPVLEASRDSPQAAGLTVTARTLSVDFLADDRAIANVEIMLGDQPLALQVEVVLINNRWLISTNSFCGLVAAAGVDCDDFLN